MDVLLGTGAVVAVAIPPAKSEHSDDCARFDLQFE